MNQGFSLIQRLCVIGVGLIGGSLALALRRAGAVAEIVGAGRDEAHLRRAVELGIIDRYDENLARAVRGSDMIVLAVPLGAIRPVCAAIRDQLDPDAILTDVGSAKRSVVDAVQAVFGELPAHFVPGHPIAGTERSGVEAGFAELFCERRVILTPLPQTAPEAVRKVKEMWQRVGAIVEHMDLADHDRVVAATSHLPHMLAFTLVDCLARMDDREDVFRFAAGGFRDFTRIASSDPFMWRDVCLANADALLTMMERYRDDLGVIEEAVRARDSECLLRIFTRAKRARDALIAT
jgi:prephenate dehydrogenase